MRVLMVVAIIFLVLFLLSLISVKIIPSYINENLKIQVRYGLIRFNIYPVEEKPQKKGRKKAATKNKSVKDKPPDSKAKKPDEPPGNLEDSEDNSAADTAKNQPAQDVQKKKGKPKIGFKVKYEKLKEQLDSLLSMVKSSKKALKTVKKHLVVDKVWVDFEIGGEDAHQTGVTYGNQVAAVTSLIGIASQLVEVRLKNLSFAPNFLSEESRYDMKFVVRLRLIWILKAGIHLLAGLIRNSKPKTDKGGNEYESRKAY